MPSNDSARASMAPQWRRHRRLVRLGQALIAAGVAIAAVHLGMHLTGNPSGWTDLSIGYPTAAVVTIAGVILAGRATPKA